MDGLRAGLRLEMNDMNFLGILKPTRQAILEQPRRVFVFLFPFSQVFGHWWGKLGDKHGSPHVWKHTFIVSVYCIQMKHKWNNSFYINSTHGWSYPDSACPFWDYDVCPWSDHMMPCATCSGKAHPRKPLGTWTLQIGKPALWNLLQDQWGNRSRIEDVYIYMIIYVSV